MTVVKNTRGEAQANYEVFTDGRSRTPVNTSWIEIRQEPQRRGSDLVRTVRVKLEGAQGGEGEIIELLETRPQLYPDLLKRNPRLSAESRFFRAHELSRLNRDKELGLRIVPTVWFCRDRFGSNSLLTTRLESPRKMSAGHEVQFNADRARQKKIGLIHNWRIPDNAFVPVLEGDVATAVIARFRDINKVEGGSYDGRAISDAEREELGRKRQQLERDRQEFGRIRTVFDSGGHYEIAGILHEMADDTALCLKPKYRQFIPRMLELMDEDPSLRAVTIAALVSMRASRPEVVSALLEIAEGYDEFGYTQSVAKSALRQMRSWTQTSRYDKEAASARLYVDKTKRDKARVQAIRADRERLERERGEEWQKRLEEQEQRRIRELKKSFVEVHPPLYWRVLENAVVGVFTWWDSLKVPWKKKKEGDDKPPEAT